MTILVTGANGQLGNEIRITAKNSSDRYYFSDVNQMDGSDTIYLDITDIKSVRKFIQEYNVTAIVNCASYTNVEGAESNQALAEKINSEAVENLAICIKETNGLLVHISTDFVFGGNDHNLPYTEEQVPSPINVYGLSKLHGEEKVISSSCNHVIIRTSWLYSKFGNNFCKTILNLTASKPTVKVVCDQIGTPTYARDLAEAIAVVLSDFNSSVGADYSKNGIYNFSNEGACSWYDFAKAIAELGGNSRCLVQPCKTDEYPSSARRPSYSVLDKTKIKATFGIKIPQWGESLARCITSIISNKE